MIVKKDGNIEGLSFTPDKQSDSIHIFVENRIIIATYLQDVEITLEVKKEHHRIYKEVAGLKDLPLCLIIDDGVEITREARDFARKIEPKQPFTACAVVVNSLAYKILANFYVVFHKPVKPFKVFNSKESAIQWLEQFR